jgi:hypothetical protein
MLTQIDIKKELFQASFLPWVLPKTNNCPANPSATTKDSQLSLYSKNKR